MNTVRMAIDLTDGAPENRYLAAEKRLAELLGWEFVRQGGEGKGFTIPSEWLTGVKVGTIGRSLIPSWARQDSDAFALMVEHHIDVEFFVDATLANGVIHNRYQQLAKSINAEHPDRSAAARDAIVQAVIAKLEREALALATDSEGGEL